MSKNNYRSDAAISPVGVLMWPAVFKAKSSKTYPDKAPEFEATLLVDPTQESEELNKLKEYYGAALEFLGRDPKNNSITPPDKHSKDTLEKYPIFEGKLALRFKAREDYAPLVVDQAKNKLTVSESSLIYSGCLARVKYNIYTYDNSGNWGIGLGFSGLQKYAEGEKIGGGGGASVDDFGEGDTSNMGEAKEDKFAVTNTPMF